MRVIVPALYSGLIAMLADQATDAEKEQAKEDAKNALKAEIKAGIEKNGETKSSPYSPLKIVEANQASLRSLFSKTGRIGSASGATMSSSIFHTLGQKAMGGYAEVIPKPEPPPAPPPPAAAPEAKEAEGKEKKPEETKKPEEPKKDEKDAGKDKKK